MHFAGESLGRFFGCDAHCFAGVHVHERGRNFSPVAKFQSALAQAAAGDYGNGIGGTAIDLDEGNKSFAVFTARIVDAEFTQAEHRQAGAENLPGAEMSVGLLGIAEVFVEGLHKKLSAVSFQLTPKITTFFSSARR